MNCECFTEAQKFWFGVAAGPIIVVWAIRLVLRIQALVDGYYESDFDRELRENKP